MFQVEGEAVSPTSVTVTLQCPDTLWCKRALLQALFLLTLESEWTVQPGEAADIEAGVKFGNDLNSTVMFDG